MAMRSCNACSAPGLDGIGYGVLLGLSERVRDFLMSLFNQIFVDSRFQVSRGNTLLAFVPKAGSAKFPPISLRRTGPKAS